MSKLDVNTERVQEDNFRHIPLSNIQIVDTTIPLRIPPINDQTLPKIIDEFTIPIKNGQDMSVVVYQDEIGSYLDTTYVPRRYIGSCPILLEGSKDTRITYKVSGLSQHQINQVNSLDPCDIKARLDLIETFRGTIQYHTIKNQLVLNNIDQIDSWMDKILAYCLVYYYKDNISLSSHMLDHLNNVNPMKYPGQYTYFVRLNTFLSALVCGWRTNQVWIENRALLDFYQVEYENGDQFSFHFKNRVDFQEALIDNTKFDKPDPILCDYGHIYSENGESLLDLALQIRFTKE